MPHIVTDNCHKCRFTECVTVCPVECFHFDDEMTYIDPDACIDCGGCIPMCPVHAIYDALDIPEDMTAWIDINAQKAATLPVLKQKMPPHPEAEIRRIQLGFSQ